MAISKENKQFAKLRNELCFQVPEVVDSVSSGNLMLDWATGIGGIPRGTMIDIWGVPGLGKTTMVLGIMGERVRAGERCVLIDVEQRLNPNLVNIMIPNQELFEVLHPNGGDAALKLLEELINLKDEKTDKPWISMIGIDSMSVIVPDEVYDPDYNQNRPGLAAARITATLKKIATPVRKNGTIVFLIEQMRANLNFMGRSNLVPTSNWATQHLTSLRFALSTDSPIREGEKTIGHKLTIVAVKNTFSAPGGKAPITLLYGKGLDRIRDLIECGLITGVIRKDASWFKYESKDKKGAVSEIRAHGEAELIEKLTPIMPQVYERIREAMMKLKTVMPETTTSKAEERVESPVAV